MINKGKSSDSVIEKLKNYVAALNSSDIAGIKVRKQSIISSIKKHAAKKRWEADPKTVDKLYVKERWLEWRAKPTNYKSKASFALDMLDKYESLTSTKVIENWCRVWEKE